MEKPGDVLQPILFVICFSFYGKIFRQRIDVRY